MPKQNDLFGGPAFPMPEFVDPDTGLTLRRSVEGMSLQTYAAIHLCVPMSEHPIINEMIEKARRDRFAAGIFLETDLLERVSQCDDADLLERFGTEEEKAEGFTLCFPGARNEQHSVSGRPEFGGDVPYRNIELRQKLEATARAQLRAIEANAMIAKAKGSSHE